MSRAERLAALVARGRARLAARRRPRPPGRLRPRRRSPTSAGSPASPGPAAPALVGPGGRDLRHRLPLRRARRREELDGFEIAMRRAPAVPALAEAARRAASGFDDAHTSVRVHRAARRGRRATAVELVPAPGLVEELRRRQGRGASSRDRRGGASLPTRSTMRALEGGLAGRTEREVAARRARPRMRELGAEPSLPADRRRRPERRAAARRARRARDRRGRAGRLRHGRRARRLLLGLHPHLRDRRARGRGARGLRAGARRAGGGARGGPAPGRRAARSTPSRASRSPRPATASTSGTGSATASGSRSTRRRGSASAPRTSSRPATWSRSSPASTCRGASGSGSRTWSSSPATASATSAACRRSCRSSTEPSDGVAGGDLDSSRGRRGRSVGRRCAVSWPARCLLRSRSRPRLPQPSCRRAAGGAVDPTFTPTASSPATFSTAAGGQLRLSAVRRSRRRPRRSGSATATTSPRLAAADPAAERAEARPRPRPLRRPGRRRRVWGDGRVPRLGRLEHPRRHRLAERLHLGRRLRGRAEDAHVHGLHHAGLRARARSRPASGRSSWAWPRSPRSRRATPTARSRSGSRSTSARTRCGRTTPTRRRRMTLARRPDPGWYAGDFHVHGEHEPGNATMRETFDYAFGPYGGDGRGPRLRDARRPQQHSRLRRDRALPARLSGQADRPQRPR